MIEETSNERIDLLIQAARDAFPQFPQEVCDLWLDDRVREAGWPPNGPEWEGFLVGKTIEYWRRLRWRKTDISIELDELTDSSFQLVKALLHANIRGVENIVSKYVTDTQKRFTSLDHFVQQFGSLPQPAILLKMDDSVQIIDGYHRLAVLFKNAILPSDGHVSRITFSSWIAE